MTSPRVDPPGGAEPISGRALVAHWVYASSEQRTVRAVAAVLGCGPERALLAVNEAEAAGLITYDRVMTRDRQGKPKWERRAGSARPCFEVVWVEPPAST